MVINWLPLFAILFGGICCLDQQHFEDTIKDATLPTNIMQEATLITPVPVESPPTVEEHTRIVPTVHRTPLTKEQIEKLWNNKNSIEVLIPEAMRVRLENETNILSEPLSSLRQVPVNPLTLVVNRSPCECLEDNLCKCCTGMIMQAFNSQACMNLKYIPEELALDVRMMMNDVELYRRSVSGKNPPPMCFAPERIPFVDVCATFYDIHFKGRNLNVCLDVSAYFQEFEVFNRPFDCMKMGSQGVKVMKGSGPPEKPSFGGGDGDADGDDDDLFGDIL